MQESVIVYSGKPFSKINSSFNAAITCSILTDPSNGAIIYTTDTVAPFDYQTTATYSCDNGFRLSVVGNTINCVGSHAGPGEWSGAAPICEGISTGGFALTACVQKVYSEENVYWGI